MAKLVDCDPEHLVIPKQTHSNHVGLVTSPGNLNNTDSIITQSIDVVLSIQVADCIPIFIADPITKTIGLIHAGWRGGVNGIVHNSIVSMEEAGANPRDIHVVFGPSIRQCCFEVKDDVLGHFPKPYQYVDPIGTYWIDLHGMVIRQLEETGINASNISDMKSCTKCHSQTYHSYRAEGLEAGRNIALMALKF